MGSAAGGIQCEYPERRRDPETPDTIDPDRRRFGDIKENENFRRFNYRSAEKVYKEFMLYAIGRNILKYHRFLHHEIEKYEGKNEQKAA